MPYNQYGQWVEDSGFSPLPGAGMPSVTSGGATLGPGGWSDAGPWRTVNDPRESYQPLYDHTHMDEASAFGGMLGPGYGQNTPQRSRALQLLQGLQQQRQQPLQGFVQPGIYQNDPTDPRQSQFSQYGGASQGRGGAVDNVYTGHATERLREDPRILGMIPQLQRQMYGGAPDVGSLVATGGITRMAPMAAQPLVSDDEAHTKFLRYVQQQMGNGTMDAEQASALHSHVFGVDPQAYATNQRLVASDTRNATDDVTAQNIKVAVEMDRRRKALLDRRAELARQSGGIPEDIIASYGRNTAPGDHTNEWYNPGVAMGTDELGQPKIEKEGWRTINPGTVAELIRLQREGGLGDAQPFDINAARAEQASLMARRAAHLAGNAVDAIPTNISARPQTTPGVRAHDYLASGQLARDAQRYGPQAQAQSRVGRWYLNPAISMLNAPNDVQNFFQQLVMGRDANQLPTIPYIPPGR